MALTASADTHLKVAVDAYIISGNWFTVALRRGLLLLRGVNKPIYYTAEKDLDALAQFKLGIIEQLHILWFYESDGYSAAYIDARSHAHVVLTS